MEVICARKLALALNNRLWVPTIVEHDPREKETIVSEKLMLHWSMIVGGRLQHFRAYFRYESFLFRPKSSWVKQQLLAYLPHSHPSESHPLGRKWRPHGGLFESIVGQWDLCNQWLLVVAIGFPKSTSQKDLLKIYTVSLSYFHLTLSIFEWILRESCKIFGNLRVLYPPNPRPPLLSLNKALFLEDGGIGGDTLRFPWKISALNPHGFCWGWNPWLRRIADVMELSVLRFPGAWKTESFGGCNGESWWLWIRLKLESHTSSEHLLL